MSSAIITVENLGKKYRITHQASGQRYSTLRDVLTEKAKGVIQKLKFRKQKTEINAAEGKNQFPLSNFPISTLPRSEDFWALERCFLRGQTGRSGGRHRAQWRGKITC